jgi:hypothetical protein
MARAVRNDRNAQIAVDNEDGRYYRASLYIVGLAISAKPPAFSDSKVKATL